MLVYQETGKTKSGEIRITRPIGALMISLTGSWNDLTNEKISVFVERAGTSLDIAVNVPLKDFISLTTFGESAIKTTGANSTALCEIAYGGVIELGTNESIKVVLSDLKPLVEYTVHGIEFPKTTNLIAKFDKRTILNDETSRRLNVENSDVLVIAGFSVVNEIHVGYSNGVTVKYNNPEFAMLGFDVDPIAEITNNGEANYLNADYVVFPMIGVNSIDVYKDAGVVSITTLDQDNLNTY